MSKPQIHTPKEGATKLRETAKNKGGASPISVKERRSLDTTRIGDVLERRMVSIFQAEIDADRFWVRQSNCKIFWKKGYYSKDRGAKIVFDIAIEIYLPGVKEYSSLILIECKNYAGSVPVSDVEEFFAKVQQVAPANSKAIVASNAAFQTGARSYAKSKGIGLVRYLDAKGLKWELLRSPSATPSFVPVEDEASLQDGHADEDFQSDFFDLYMQSPSRSTNSLWVFCGDLLCDSGLSHDQIRSIKNPRDVSANQVSFLQPEELEALGEQILARIDYSGGEVDLARLCSYEAQRTGLVVKLGVPPPEDFRLSGSLGRISFNPSVIEVYVQQDHNRGRERFTLAHELAHHFLNHGHHLVSESCDDGDFVLQRDTALSQEIRRIEFQANFVAASILMPKVNVLSDFNYLIRALEIPDKGFGRLYVDDQICNLKNYEVVTGALMNRYGVSRAAISIRLSAIGVLHDARREGGPRPLLEALASPCEV